MATHAKKKFVVDPSEARYTGGHRRAFGSDLYEVEFFDGDRSGERIWVRQAPTAAQTRERMKRELADRRGLRKKVRSLEEAGPMCPPCAVDPDAVSGFPPRHRAQNSAMPETLADVVRRQAAEEEEHERRALDPNDDYPAGPVVVPRRMKDLARGRARRKPPVAGDVLLRTFKGRELSLRVVEIGGQPECLGYEAESVVYPSLTAAAEHYTGYPVSGPVFWGLR